MHKLTAVILSLLLLSTFAFAEEENASTGAGNSGENRGHSGEAPGQTRQTAAEPGDNDEDGPVQVGWAIVTPLAVTTSSGSTGLVVFATFGLKRGQETAQAGLLPSALTTNSLLFVSTNGKLS